MLCHILKLTNKEYFFMIFFYKHRLTTAGTSLRSEPKHIVFLSQLLLLFNFCHVCKTDNPSIEERQIGTKAVVTSTCHNPKCPKQVNTSHSQPNMPNSGIAAGNFLLCMAVLLAAWRLCYESLPDILTHGSWLCVPQHLL